MTVAVTAAYSGPYLGTGAQTAFPYTFKAFTAGEVQVLVDGIAQVVGYAVTPGTDGNGGTVTFDMAPASGAEIIIASDPDFDQDISFTNSGAFLPETHDEANDRAAVRDIFLQSQIARAPKVPLGETASPLPSPANSAGLYLGYDASGDFVASSGTGADAGLRADLALASGASLLAWLPAVGLSAMNLQTALRLGLPQMPEHYGAVGDDATDDSGPINQVIAAVNAAGGGIVALARGKSYYAGTTPIAHKSNVHIEGNGATIRGSGNYVVGDTSSVTGHSLSNVNFVQSGNSDSKYVFDFAGQVLTMRDVSFASVPATHAVTGYFRGTSAYVNADGFKISGANGIFVSGHDHSFDNYKLVNGGGQDDGWVMKAAGTAATPAQTYNISFGRGEVTGFGAAFSFGSEAGLSGGSNDPDRKSYIRNVSVNGAKVIQCTSLAYFKPGAIYDYRDGDVENITFSNCTLEDMTGSISRRMAYFTLSRGARIRYVRFNNIRATFRTPDRTQGTNAGLAFVLISNTVGSIAGEINHIYVNGTTIVDPFGGIANGATTTSGYNGLPSGSTVPGYPIDNIVNVDASTGGGGTLPSLKRVVFTDLVGNGCARTAVALAGTAAPGIVGPILFTNPELRNYAAAPLGSADNGAFNVGAKIEVHGLKAMPSSLAPAGTRGAMSDSQSDKTAEIVGEVMEIGVGDLAAGASAFRQFIAPVDCWVRKVEIVNRAAITADATNKITVTLTNKDTNAQLAQKDSNTNFAVAAFTPVSVNGADQFSGANAYLTRGKVMDISLLSGGTATLQGAMVIVHYVPYGDG